MSRTDNTVPWRLRHQYGIPEYRFFAWGYRSAAVQVLTRKHARRARQQARLALRRGLEPEPYRPRHAARWEAW